MIGGDHLIYLDFKRRFDLDARIEEAADDCRPDLVLKLEKARHKAGVLLTDVAGHRITDHLLAAMLHQAFLLGTRYEMDFFGEITSRLFENINVRFHKSSRITKYLTMVYGEIAGDGTFRFLSAAHPLPRIFSREFDRFVEINPDHLTIFSPHRHHAGQGGHRRKGPHSFPGLQRPLHRQRNQPDGKGGTFCCSSPTGCPNMAVKKTPGIPHRLGTVLKKVKDQPSRDIVESVKNDLLAWAPPSDDISLVVIKRTS